MPASREALAVVPSSEGPSNPSRELARRARNGDDTAFQALVVATTPKLFRVAARIVGDAAEAEDVLQDAYLRAFDALSSGRFDEQSSVETWLYRIVANAALDALRARKRRRARTEVELADEASTVNDEPRILARRALQELDQWLSELPEEQRMAIVLKELEGLSSNEVAAMMKCSVGAVEQKLVRARVTLRQRSENRDE